MALQLLLRFLLPVYSPDGQNPDDQNILPYGECICSLMARICCLMLAPGWFQILDAQNTVLDCLMLADGQFWAPIARKQPSIPRLHSPMARTQSLKARILYLTFRTWSPRSCASATQAAHNNYFLKRPSTVVSRPKRKSANDFLCTAEPWAPDQPRHLLGVIPMATLVTGNDHFMI